MFDLNGITPVVANSSQNNGIGGYTNKKPTEDGGIITFSDTTTSDSIFYQSSPFVGYPHVQGLYPLKNKEIWTEKVLLYVVVAFRKAAFGRFDYATKFTRVIAKDMEIRLPYTQRGGIDFAYMESRIREMEAYLKVAGFEDCELTEEERSSIELMNRGNVVFNSFNVTDDNKKKRENGVFAVKNSHNILQSSVVVGSGNIPYVTAGEGNNSVYAYISYDKNQIEEGNAIMIGGKTMVVTYQADDFFSNDSHNLVLYVKDKRLRKELIQLFMVASLNKSLKPIYSWGDSISKTKIVKDKINLPVTSSGSIDYKFMETYIRAIEKQTIQRVKD